MTSPLLDSDGTEAIQVVIRIRPMQKHEKARGDTTCVKPISDGKGFIVKTNSCDIND